MKWSQQSLNLFDTFETSTDNLIVEACPGAGKTTNQKELWSRSTKPTVYLVFGKANAEEAKEKLPRKARSDILTLNSLGARALYHAYGPTVPDKNKVRDIVRRELKRSRFLSETEFRDAQWSLICAVDKAKQVCLDSEMSEDDYASMVSTYDLEEYEDMFEDINKVLEISDNQHTVIDFNDQIRLPALYNIPLPHYDLVLGDEWQDTSPIQIELMKRLGAERYIFVGDKHQAIYGFRGAMSNSMEYSKEYFNCKAMPLSITYRCAKEIVKEARQVFPDINAWDQSPDGLVRRATDTRFSLDGLVLCRMNAPLVKKAYELLTYGIPCHVRGRAIGDGLIKLIRQQQASNIVDLLKQLGFWQELEMAKALAKEDEAKAQTVQDKYESVLALARNCKLTDSPEVVCANIDRMFHQGRGVCLSTIHKAKGLEAESCYILESESFDYFIARAPQPWIAEQEKNVKFVALTRARTELVYM